MRLAVLVVLAACGSPAARPAPPASPVDPFALPRYAGVTTCGRAVPAPPPPEPARMPEREPVPSFVAPRGDVDDAAAAGDLSSDFVNRTMRADATRLRACYLRLLDHDPDAGGFTVHAHFTIVEDGRTAGVEIHGHDGAMDACLCAHLAALRFGPGVRAEVSYPLIFD
ncbi:MAG TPA: hypothetical protein VLX92_33470 [Kofleriaceae bacterium]|nr:hypothetical protein [Kofleriaceae bacterium]